MYHKLYTFWYSPENSKKLNQKTDFFDFFWRFFDYALLRPMSYAQIFCQMKGLMKIHNCVNHSKSLQKTLHRKKNLFNVVLILLGQHCIGKNVVDNIAQEKILLTLTAPGGHIVPLPLPPPVGFLTAVF